MALAARCAQPSARLRLVVAARQGEPERSSFWLDFDLGVSVQAMARVLLMGLVMKTLTTLALLLSLSALAAGCMAPTGDEPTQRSEDALMNNGGGPQGPSMDDLLAAGYHCVAIDVPATPLACGKDGSNDVYLCNPDTRVCVPAPAPTRTAPPVVIHRPITGPIKALQ